MLQISPYSKVFNWIQLLNLVYKILNTVKNKVFESNESCYNGTLIREIHMKNWPKQYIYSILKT